MALSKALKAVHDTLMRSHNHLQVVGLHHNSAGQWQPTDLVTHHQHTSSSRQAHVIVHREKFAEHSARGSLEVLWLQHGKAAPDAITSKRSAQSPVLTGAAEIQQQSGYNHNRTSSKLNWMKLLQHDFGQHG